MRFWHIFLANDFADFLYSAGNNNQDFVQSLVAFWISNICYCVCLKWHHIMTIWYFIAMQYILMFLVGKTFWPFSHFSAVLYTPVWYMIQLFRPPLWAKITDFVSSEKNCQFFSSPQNFKTLYVLYIFLPNTKQQQKTKQNKTKKTKQKKKKAALPLHFDAPCQTFLPTPPKKKVGKMQSFRYLLIWLVTNCEVSNFQKIKSHKFE